MKFTTLAVTTLVAVASAAFANDYQPALRALAVPEPVAPVAAEHNVQQPASPTASVDATGKEATHADNKDGDEKKKKEWGGGGFGWGGPWGGCGNWGRCGGWGGWGGFGGWKCWRKEEKLRLETQRKEYDEAVKEQNRLREQENALKEACAKMKKTEPEVGRVVRAISPQRQTRRKEASEQLHGQRSELQQRQGDFRVFSDKCKQGQHGELDKLERQVQALSDSIAQTKQREDTAVQASADLVPQMQSAQTNLSPNEVGKRQIQDNIDYRELQKQLEKMRAEVADLQNHIGKLPSLDDVNDRVESADAALSSAEHSASVMVGKRQQLLEELRVQKAKLRVPTLKDVEEKYRHKLI
ncbi:uncharacterized protein PITG_13528 [Phytophthora infestans T30-4]|uniref:Secreted RxLR effector peptide protein n=1 Tax=Phytophthora infestans (strain T30-4) TaxID=403677 RepID=D0NM72_PHYIT|nr:uncharacterized protein PITG_13528 [Phytophthora infestans T30-4]EEY60793.1 conserved hypothetical protein [Phytophthora infestans T30-4]|eukprot:XP_002899739.1 conserved hypothetical protein [Phytophthora infestans T30-4]